MTYDFLVDTYATERVKVVSVWSEFTDGDLAVRPRSGDPRGRSVHEQMVHQCVSEDPWFRTMLGIDLGSSPMPLQETRLEFIRPSYCHRTIRKPVGVCGDCPFEMGPMYEVATTTLSDHFRATARLLLKT